MLGDQLEFVISSSKYTSIYLSSAPIPAPPITYTHTGTTGAPGEPASGTSDVESGVRSDGGNDMRRDGGSDMRSDSGSDEMNGAGSRSGIVR